MLLESTDERVFYTLIYISLILFRHVFPQVFGIFDVFSIFVQKLIKDRVLRLKFMFRGITTSLEG